MREVLESSQKEYKDNISKLQKENDKVSDSMRKLEEKYASKGSQHLDIFSVKEENEKLKALVEEYKTEIGTLRKDITGLVGDLNDIKKHITEKNQSLAEKEEVILGLRKQVDSQLKEIETFKNGLNSQNSMYKEQLTQSEEAKATLENKLSESEKLREKHEAKLKAKMDEFTEMEKNMKLKMDYLHNDMEKQK